MITSPMEPALTDTRKRIVENWLNRFAYTANAHRIDDHLQLVSNRLLVVGISQRGYLSYAEWAERRRNDLASGRLLRLVYRHLALGECSADLLRFHVEETIKGSQGEHFVLDKDVVLERDEDGAWRETEEVIRSVRIFPETEYEKHFHEVLDEKTTVDKP